MRTLFATASVLAAVAVGCSPDEPGEEPGYLDEPNAAVAAATDR